MPATSSADAAPAFLTAEDLRSGYDLDWVPVEAMTAEQRQRVNPNCCGAFVDIERPAALLQQDPADQGTRIIADDGLSQVSSALINVDGDVVVSQGYRTVQNNGSTSIDRSANTVLMDGEVRFREPGVL